MPDLDALRQDLRYAIRALARKPAFALAAILTLGLGIGVNTAVFTVVNALLLRPLPFGDPDRLVFVQTKVGGEAGKAAMREVKALMIEATIFDDVAAYYRSQYNVTGSGRPESIPTTIGTHNILRVLGLQPVLGSTWPASYDFRRHYTLMVSHGLWRRRFGADPDIVGKRIRLDVADYEVVGVAPPGADFPDRAEAFRSITDYNAEDQRRLSVIARLKPGVSIAEARGHPGVAARIQHRSLLVVPDNVGHRPGTGSGADVILERIGAETQGIPMTGQQSQFNGRRAALASWILSGSSVVVYACSPQTPLLGKHLLKSSQNRRDSIRG